MPKIGRINAIREIIMAAPERIDRLLVVQDGGSRRVQELAALAASRRIPVQAVAKRQLDHLSPRHQGLLARIPRTWAPSSGRQRGPVPMG
jgi:tRNA G18 (ribose-2'-O)-methylase SpoU